MIPLNPFNPFNPWANPDMLGSEAATNLAHFIDTRGQLPDQARLQQALVERLAPQPAETILDLGCGSGVIARRIAPLVGLNGTVIGIDRSQAMIAVAKQLADHPALCFRQGDTVALDIPDAHAHAAIAARLLMHVQDPLAILAEAHRVVMPGGRLALLEFDWGTVALDHSDRALTRRILEWRTDHLDGNNWTGRQLVRLCRLSGWRVQHLDVLVTSDTDGTTTLPDSFRRAADLACQRAIITQDEYHGWIAELEQRLLQGHFYASINDYLVLATNTEKDTS